MATSTAAVVTDITPYSDKPNVSECTNVNNVL